MKKYIKFIYAVLLVCTYIVGISAYGNPYSSKVDESIQTRLSPIFQKLEREITSLPSQQGKQKKLQLIETLTDLGKKPQYQSNQTIQNLVVYIIYEVNQIGGTNLSNIDSFLCELLNDCTKVGTPPIPNTTQTTTTQTTNTPGCQNEQKLYFALTNQSCVYRMFCTDNGKNTLLPGTTEAERKYPYNNAKLYSNPQDCVKNTVTDYCAAKKESLKQYGTGATSEYALFQPSGLQLDEKTFGKMFVRSEPETEKLLYPEYPHAQAPAQIRIPSPKEGKYVAFKFEAKNAPKNYILDSATGGTPAFLSAYNYSWSPLYDSNVVNGRYVLTLTECPGDFRLPTNSNRLSEDPELGFTCRITSPTTTLDFKYNVTPQAGFDCKIEEGKIYYMNFLMADPRDGIQLDESTCDGKIDHCYVIAGHDSY